MRHRFLVLLAITACVHERTPGPLAPPVATSPLDARSYELLQLDNGLRALLVSDPDTDMAAASLVVHVGSFADPPDRPGLSHFLEHMLFLGTDRFPDAGAYREFIGAHGGTTNGETGAETTQFTFEVEEGALDEAFARFARFFVAPTFDPAYVERERNAVENEFRLRFGDEVLRANRVLQLTADPDHPVSRASCGTLETLADHDGDPVHGDLRDHYASRYRASDMTLVVLGRESLPRLRALVTEGLANVPNPPIVTPAAARPPPFLPEQVGVRIDTVPLEEKRELVLQFAIPPEHAVWPAAPGEYVASLLSAGGSGTLSAALKSAGWIETLDGGTGGADDFDLLEIDVGLTDDGVAHVSEIVSAVFQGIAQIRETGVEPFRVDEDRVLRQLTFGFAQESAPDEAVKSAALALHDYPVAHVLDHDAVLADVDPALLASTLSLLTPDRVRLIVTLPEARTDHVDPLYDVAWAIRPLTDAEKATFAAGSDLGFSFPPRNPYLPEDTSLVTGRSGTVPTQLSAGRMDLWHLQDTRFGVPQAFGALDLWSPDPRADDRSRAMTALLAQMLNVELDDLRSPLERAGLTFELTDTDRGLHLTFSGYSDRQDQMVSDLVEHIASFAVDPARFDAERARAVREWQNVSHEWPIYQAVYARGQALRPWELQPESAIALAPELTVDGFRAFVDTFRDGLSARMFVHGNVTADQARAMAEAVERTLLTRGDADPVPMPVVRLLPAGETLVRDVAIDHDDATLLVAYQGRPTDAATHARWMLLEQLLSKPFFDELRTEQQLGYVVQLSYAPSSRVPGLALLIQSAVTGPVTLLARVDAFLASQDLGAMPIRDFETARGGLVAQLREKNTELAAENERLAEDLDLGVPGFDWDEQVAAAVEDLDRDTMAAFYREVFLADDTGRLVVRSFGAHPEASTAGCPDTACLESRLATRWTLGL